jgi:hypothetical protein
MPPPWKEAEAKSLKSGLRATVHLVGGDEYTGEWLADKKHGRVSSTFICPIHSS